MIIISVSNEDCFVKLARRSFNSRFCENVYFWKETDKLTVFQYEGKLGETIRMY